MLSKQSQEDLKKSIKLRLLIKCDECYSDKFKKSFSYIGTYRGNICMDCQEKDNY